MPGSRSPLWPKARWPAASLLSLLLLAAFPGSAQECHVPLARNWTVGRVGELLRYPAVVPGSVQTDLLRHGLIADPFRNSNADSLRWMENVDWAYACTFTADGDLFRNEQVDLVFKGLDTFASVYLNDSLLGRADNMFRTWKWPVKSLLRPGLNHLQVVFHSPIKEGKKLRATYGIPLPHDSDPEGSSPYIRKAAYQFGWDFVPRTMACGIWQPVELHGWNAACILALNVQQQATRDSIAVDIGARIRNQRPVSARLFLDDTMIDSMGPVLREPGIKHLHFHFLRPMNGLWWPQGSGGRPLHRLRLELVDAEGAILSYSEQMIGLRTISLQQDTDSMGQAFTFVVNGKPLFMQGANIVPPAVYPSLHTDSAWVALVADAKRAHMNMLRVWAGGVYPPDAFFDACDTAGILVWQDLMVANLLPAEGPFLENIIQEVREQLARIGHHACLALICGNNELAVAWDHWGWQDKYGLHGADSARVIEANLRLWQQTFRDLAKDAGLPYTWTSPLSNWGSAEGLRHGDLHYWGVWHGDQPFAAYAANVGRFVSEYGFQSWPDSALLARFIDPAQLYIGSPALAWRQRSYKTDAPIWEAIRRETGLQPRTLGTFIAASQAVQVMAYGSAIAAHLAARPRCMGSLLWQLNDCWPGPSWSLVDVQGRWKPAMYTVQRLYSR